MKRFIDEPVEGYAREHTQSEPQLLSELTTETWETMEYPQMLSGRLSGRFLKMLVQISHAKTVLEVGMYTGYSALSLAEGLPKDGKLIACDINEKTAAVARKYFEKSPHGKKIEIEIAPALETIAKIEDTIDLAFIDADKENYKNYYEAILPKLRKGGLIVLDNCLWSGSVLAPVKESDHAIVAVNSHILQDDRVENVILTVRDGLNLVRKK